MNRKNSEKPFFSEILMFSMFYAVCVRDMDKRNMVKLANGVKVLSSSQFLLLPQMPQKMMLAL